MNYKYGSRDTEKDKGVAQLQTKLKEKGYDIAVDGIYGKETQNAVTQYQTANKLKVNGIAGNETLSSLGIQKTAKPTTTTVAQPTTAQTANQKLTQLATGTFSALGDMINNLYDKVINQKPFEYEPTADPTYNRYADIYARNAKLTSEDAMAQAAMLTGGYGSSYGQAVATQAYNEEMSKMNDIIPELRQQALAEHENERAKNIEALTLLLKEREYERGIYESDRTHQLDQDKFDWQKGEANLDRIDAAQDRTDRREELALSAGFKSWDEYVKAVDSGYNNKIDISDFDADFRNKAIEAWKQGGSEGLQDFFAENMGDYSYESLEALGNLIADLNPREEVDSDIPEGATYPKDVPVMRNIIDVEKYLKETVGELSDDDEEFLEDLLSYSDMKDDGVDDENDTEEAWRRYLTWKLHEYLLDREYN